jgi:DNA-binding NarL/FixJ family response regulator
VPGIALVIMDMKLRDCGGFVGLFEMRSEFPEVPIIVLSTNADPEPANRTMAFGAAGYISKSAPCEAIVQTVKTILSGRPWAHGSVAARAGQVNPIATLSRTQLRVLAGLKRGLRNKQIAFEMGVTEKTVKSYMSTLYRKLGVNSRTQALILLQEVLSNTQLQQVS